MPIEKAAGQGRKIPLRMTSPRMQNRVLKKLAFWGEALHHVMIEG